MKKKRNSQDTTCRNINALKKRVNELENIIKEMIVKYSHVTK